MNILWVKNDLSAFFEPARGNQESRYSVGGETRPGGHPPYDRSGAGLGARAEVLPAIRAARPGAVVAVVGRRPLPSVQALAARHPEVRVAGEVPDVRPYLARAAVMVVPLRIGRGTRINISAAMACGNALVSTPLDAERRNIDDGTNILLANGARSPAAAVVALLRDDRRRPWVGQADCRLCTERFWWQRVPPRFGKICAQAATGWRESDGRRG